MSEIAQIGLRARQCARVGARQAFAQVLEEGKLWHGLVAPARDVFATLSPGDMPDVSWRVSYVSVRGKSRGLHTA